jgi:DHA2 family methylenomycin A resistance protein-like MFS transporter
VRRSKNILDSKRVAERGLRPIVIVATALGFVLVQLDVSIVNVALATIAKDLRSDFASLQWIVDAYAVTFAAFLLSAGSLADRIGARRTFVVGFVLFVLSSIACGFAPSAGVLIAARTLQGLGAALLVPCSLALLNAAAAGNAVARARAVGLWTASGSIALAAGPIVGGALVGTLGWRSIFFVNVPLGGLGVWLVLANLRETPASGGTFDVPGQLTAVGALAGTLSRTAPLVLALLAFALACGAAFVVVEKRRARPMLPLELFGRRPFSAAAIVGLLVNFTLYGAIFMLGLYFQHQERYTPLQTGLAFLPFCLALGIANVAAGRLTAARGARLPMTIGLLVAGIGYAALAPAGVGSPYPLLLFGLILAPLGIGFAVPAMTTAMLASVERERSGIASGVLNTVRQAGGALGVAVLGSLSSAYGIAGLRGAFIVSAALMAGGALVALILLRAPRRPSDNGATDAQNGREARTLARSDALSAPR